MRCFNFGILFPYRYKHPHRVLDGDRLAHDVDLAGVQSLIVRRHVDDLEAVVITETHPGVLPHDQVAGTQDPVCLLPHHDKVVQVGHVARQQDRVALLRSKDLKICVFTVTEPMSSTIFCLTQPCFTEIKHSDWMVQVM